jgi:hypothetical protein
MKLLLFCFSLIVPLRIFFPKKFMTWANPFNHTVSVLSMLDSMLAKVFRGCIRIPLLRHKRHVSRVLPKMVFSLRVAMKIILLAILITVVAHFLTIILHAVRSIIFIGVLILTIFTIAASISLSVFAFVRVLDI